MVVEGIVVRDGGQGGVRGRGSRSREAPAGLLLLLLEA